MKTIEIGIDLGTTNSAVAIVRNGDIEIIKNSSGEDVTPSIVCSDKNGNLLIGSRAKKKSTNESTLDSAQNWRSEIKRLMGTKERISLSNYPKELSPEEISSEILKSLIVDVKRRYPDIDASSAVITVPAHFSTLQSEATKRAGELSGVNNVILLQEPIAAALAYGLSAGNNENWLIYDLGGGTFDVALVASRSGSLTILAHGGDNFLGGKDIDAAIVDNFIIPMLKSKGHNYNYLGDPNLHKKLRLFAEQAKIDLSISECAEIDIELQIDNSKISEVIAFDRQNLLQVCLPIFNKTISICKETLSESNIDLKTVKKVVLVGGPTQMPILRTYIEKELEISTDGSQDPLTVVAKGAALFAKQIPNGAFICDSEVNNTSDQTYTIAINFSPVTSEEQQTVTGKVELLNNKNGQPAHTIRFQSENKNFDSGDIILKNKKFIIQLPTGAKSTQYWIYLKDDNGNLLNCSPDSILVSKGVTITGAPLPHSIGVSILSFDASNGFIETSEVMDIFFKKNTILPISATKRFHTVSALEASQTENALPIRVYEGESPTPNRNVLICDLAITRRMIVSDLKKGAPVDVTLSVDESRQLTVKAYLPEIDISLNARATIYDEDITVESLKETLNEETKRSKEITSDSDKSIDKMDGAISEIKTTLDKSVHDPDQKRKALKQLKTLMVSIDDAEAKASFDKNCLDFLKLAEDVQQYIAGANPIEKRSEYSAILASLKKEGIGAIEVKDSVILKQLLEKLKSLHFLWMCNDPQILIMWMERVQEDREEFEDKKMFDTQIKKCEEAINNNSIEDLKSNLFAIFRLDRGNKVITEKILKAGITK